MTVVMLSTEVDEHVELMDRVLVFRENELFDEITGDALSPEVLVAAFFGEKVGASSGN
jgi:ABC-type sugar transport system ATPase subunit